SDNVKNNNETTEISQNSTSEAVDFAKVNSAKAADLFDDVESKIQNILNDGSEYAVYLAYPQQTDEVFIYNSQQWRSASMIKVFILATAMEMAQNGELSLDETVTLQSADKVGGAGILVGYSTGSQLSLRQVLKLMITHSDNTATNIAINRLGMSTINDYIARNNYNDTILQRKMMDMDAIYAGRENYTSVRDLGNFFLKLYKHECVSEEYDEIMLDFLKAQTDDECFNTALPDKVIAHKTGALSGLFDEGGIIYNGENDTILVIMTENFTSEKIVIGRMKKFARAVVY
ncbi:MAG: serine hydrolase, partial [Selenomonadaceae bacterium]|nr:serine hydrolase [Selenomonadaceae bacterium]